MYFSLLTKKGCIQKSLLVKSIDIIKNDLGPQGIFPTWISLSAALLTTTIVSSVGVSVTYDRPNMFWGIRIFRSIRRLVTGYAVASATCIKSVIINGNIFFVFVFSTDVCALRSKFA